MNEAIFTASSLLAFAIVDLIEINILNSLVKFQSNEPQIIEITQAGYQFIETEEKTVDLRQILLKIAKQLIKAL